MKAKTHFDAKGQALAHAMCGLPPYACRALMRGYLAQLQGIKDTAMYGASWRNMMRSIGEEPSARQALRRAQCIALAGGDA